MNSELRNALEVIVKNCEKNEDCFTCELSTAYGCWLADKTPMSYLEELEKFEIESECKE